jgi:hypothetical protein
MPKKLLNKHQIREYTRRLKSCLLLLLLLPSLILTACGGNQPLLRDGNISSVSIQDYVSSGEQVTARAQCGEAVVTIKNAIGDSHSLCALLEIKLPEGTCQSVPEKVIKPRAIEYFSAHTAYEAITGMNFNEAVSYILNNEDGFLDVSSSGVTTLERGGPDVIRFFIRFTSIENNLSGQPLTVLIDDIGYESLQGFQTLYEGPLVVSWTPDTEGPVYSFDFNACENLKGTGMLTSYFLWLQVESEDQELKGSKNIDVLTGSITFSFKDGSSVTLENIEDGSGATAGRKYSTYSWKFRNIVNLLRLETITIGDEVIFVDRMQSVEKRLPGT